MEFGIRALAIGDRDWVRQVLTEHWGAAVIVNRGRVHQADRLPGLVAMDAAEPVGLLTYHVENGQLEVVTLNSWVEGQGIGTALLEGAEAVARSQDCRRLWLVTTNDNVPAIEFYQRRGLRLVAVHRGAVNEARKLKPQIPTHGIGGVPMTDELEFALEFGAAAKED
ncbi:MAG TPA: GNAT family N-acetyltransferase [Planctomycetota bacterium]|jgi:ribosomal protein S18 acetylase RimI-like enzyme|nr:GNAT family N-acetyltransferase [Planctomycetota bacterium]